jgi:hypothetical protein
MNQKKKSEFGRLLAAVEFLSAVLGVCKPVSMLL